MSAHTELPYAVEDEEAAWQAESADAVKEVVDLATKVRVWDGGRLDVDSKPGRRAVTDFFGSLHTMSAMLEVEMAARAYHDQLSERVRKTWIKEGCPYNVHIITKAVHGALYFNSVEYALSVHTKYVGEGLCARLQELLSLFGHLHSAQSLTLSDKDEVLAAAAAFDAAWASFEEQFFFELPTIEAQARAVFEESVDLVNDLDRIAGNYEEDVDPKILMENPEFCAQHSRLIETISRLSSQAGCNGQGRTFDTEVLQTSEQVVEDSLATGASRDSTAASPSFTLASDAVLAWDDLCCYLYRMAQSVEWFNPDMSKNVELVRLLSAWVCTWELASTYVVDEKGSLAIGSLVSYIRAAKDIAPTFASMLEDHSSELFMVLPRLVWLRFLEDPLTVEPLISALLPHHFHALGDAARDGMTFSHDPELIALMNDYRRIWNLLASSAVAAELDTNDVSGVVQAALTSSVVVGIDDGALSPPQGVFEGPAGQSAREACKSFVRKLESWSMELQRHRPEEWNRFSAIVMRCVDPQQAAPATARP